MDKKVIVIDGNNFSDREGFYNEVDRVLTKDLDWHTGHNLNAFNDLLRGGFGVYGYEEQVMLIWKSISKSKADFGFEATKNWYRQKIMENNIDNHRFFRSELKKLTENKGQTLFDIILEIISGQQHIEADSRI